MTIMDNTNSSRENNKPDNKELRKDLGKINRH